MKSSVSKMANERNDFFKCMYLILISIAICIRCSTAILEENKFKFDFFELERLKNELFLNSDNFLGNITKLRQLQCITDLRTIGKGLSNYEQWAIKSNFFLLNKRNSETVMNLFVCSVLDAWGKIPSGFFSGNFYELGAFSQCFDIHRNGKQFRTQYCIGQIIFNSINFAPSTKTDKQFHATQLNIPNVWQTEEQKPTIMQRTAVSQ